MLQLDNRLESRSPSGFDWSLFGSVFALSVVGLINLSSALYSWGEAGSMRLWWWHLTWILLGTGIMILMSFWDYRLLESWKRIIYLTSVVLLVLVLMTGHVVSGHRSWLGVGGFGVQPSEITKVALLIVLADFFAQHPNPHGFQLRDLWRPMILVMVVAGLVAAEGDLGTTIFLGVVALTLALFAKIRWKSILILMVVLAMAAVSAYAVVLSPYQQQRIVEFLQPRRDVKGHGYQVAQSKVAVGSGQLWGKGYRNGNINKLKYLPEKHTDFVFPVLAEEWGFAGCSLVILLYLGLMRLCVRIGETAHDRFGSFLCVGVAIFFFWQIAINLGGVLGLMPMTGVTLPLLSYGGSSTLSVFVALGIVMSVSRRRNLF